MTDLSGIFKAYDVRGKVGSELTTNVVQDIGRAFADWIPAEGSIAVGRDMRPDSEEFAKALIEGLRKQGKNVWDIGQITSDMIYFVVGHYNLAGGAMVTASHNPGEYNGIKLCREEAKPVGAETGLFDIRDAFLSGTFEKSAEQGLVEEHDVVEDWITHVLSFIDASGLKPLKIAVDAGNGMAGKIFPEVEPYVPFDVHEMYFELDGSFPNHVANPIDPENIRELQQAVKERNCNVGLAFDGDGDRAVLLDEMGEPISGTVMTALLADYFLAKNPGATILLNATCGRVAYETVEKAGGKAIRTKVGHSFIKADMRTHSAVFAGETSGHYYFKDNFMADSGMIAAVIALYVISQSGKTVSELVAPYRQVYVQIQETNMQVADKQATIEKVAAAFKDGEQDWLDGLTVNYPDCWFNIRPSNTEPLLRLNAEAKTKSQLDQLLNQLKKAMGVS